MVSFPSSRAAHPCTGRNQRVRHAQRVASFSRAHTVHALHVVVQCSQVAALRCGPEPCPWKERCHRGVLLPHARCLLGHEVFWILRVHLSPAGWMVLGCTLRAPGSERVGLETKDGRECEAIGVLARKRFNFGSLAACDARAEDESCIWPRCQAVSFSRQMELRPRGAVRSGALSRGIHA